MRRRRKRDCGRKGREGRKGRRDMEGWTRWGGYESSHDFQRAKVIVSATFRPETVTFTAKRVTFRAFFHSFP